MPMNPIRFINACLDKMSFKSLLWLVLFGSILISCTPTDYDSPIEFEAKDSNIAEGVENTAILIDTVWKDGVPCLNLKLKPILPFVEPEVSIKSDSLEGVPNFGTYSRSMQIRFFEESSQVIEGDKNLLGSIPSFYSDSTLDFVAPFFGRTKKGFFGKKKLDPEIDAYLPLTMFHNLSAGMHKITMEVSFVQKGHILKMDSTTNRKKSVAKIFPMNQFSRTIQFSINVPKCYKTRIYMQEITIAEEAFTSDWDVRFLGPGTPDIMWSLLYPSQGQWPYYFNSGFVKNSRTGLFEDNVNLYHVGEFDEFRIDFYDHDQGSAHDFIDSWSGTCQGLNAPADTVAIPSSNGKIEAFTTSFKTEIAN